MNEWRHKLIYLEGYYKEVILYCFNFRKDILFIRGHIVEYCIKISHISVKIVISLCSMYYTDYVYEEWEIIIESNTKIKYIQLVCVSIY